jgi:hypothetical protein
MKIPLSSPLLLSLALLALPAAATPAAPAPVPVPAELVQPTYLYEIVRYLYRWQLDEAVIDRVADAKQLEFWIQGLEFKRDPGDHSRMGEILLPQLGVSVRVKKADYRIEELDTTVASPNFRITGVTRDDAPASPPPGAQVVRLDMQELRDFLFRTRSQQDYPDAALVARLRAAVIAEVGKIPPPPGGFRPGDKIIHVGPLSPVANELWAFWESGRKLYYFSSDIDLTNPAVWQHEALAAHIFNLDTQVVVTHDEAPGSNRFLTRHQVSRALYNCILLGQKLDLAEVPSP